MKNLYWPLITIVVILASGCSSQTSSQKTASGDPAPSCKINAKEICQAMRNTNPTMDGTGIAYDRAGTEQNSVGRTATFYTQYTLQSGNPVTVECYVNTQTRGVVYAKASLGKSLSNEDADFLRSQGMCEQ